MKQKSTTYYIIVLISFLFISINVKAQKIKRLYIANDDHTDYMWSGHVAQYDSAFVKTIDFHLRKIDSTKNELPDFQNRYNLDGNYWIKTYEKFRTPAQFSKLISAIKSEHISAPLNSVVSTFGAQPTEAAIRGMYYAGHLERKYGLKFTLATAMENNTIPLGLSSIWAGAGAKYSWKGIGGYGSQISYAARENRKHQLYNYTGLDGSSVLMKWYNYDEKKTGGFGGYAECRLDMKSKDIQKELGTVVNMLDKFCDTTANSKYPYLVAGAFGYGHDDLQTLIADPFINAAKLNSNSKRKVRVSNELDFFEDVAQTYKNLPSQSVSFGNEWDLLVASMNETTAEVRRATEKLRIAEAIAVVASYKAPNFTNDLISKRNLAWDAFGLYWEHNWTGDGPVKNQTRGLWQEQIKNDLVSYVDTLYDLSVANLGAQIKKTKNPRFYVFNALNWIRDDFADFLYYGDKSIKIVDVQTKEETPYQIIQKDGKQVIRIWASQIPSVGYKVFEIQKGNAKLLENAATWDGNYLTSPKYKIQITPSGIIKSILDIKNNRELVKEIDGKYLNDLGAKDINKGEIELVNAGPVSVTIKATANDPISHTVNITVFSNSDRIDIENSIDENFTDNKFWTFSFNLVNPTTLHEELGAILTVKKESKGGNYADEIARYDWQTFNHFADLSTNDFGITLSNLDCSFFKLGKSSIDSLWDNSSQITALAGGRIDKKVEDGGVLGIHDQMGAKKFNYHFSIMPHAGGFNSVQSMKMALAHQNPLTSGLVTGSSGSNKQLSFSLLNTTDPNLILWSVKPAEEGIKDGYITRFWNLKNEPVNDAINFFKPIKTAFKISSIETNQEEIKPNDQSLEMNFNNNQIQSFRLKVK
jgi:alpha-mannosidase